MWLLTFLFGITTVLIGWVLFGYFIYVWFAGLLRSRVEPELPEAWPQTSVVVPCYNEQADILAKLADLRALDYPSEQLEVVFADGGSTDRTRELLADAITEDEPFRVVACGPVGKIGQLNAVLPELRGEIIVNTDVDARLAPDALRWIAAEFAASESVSVVGAYCRPEGPLALERYYWDQQNKGRFLESDAGAASIVVAPCYAFRRTLLTAFPDDVVADDIYVAFLAHAERCGVVYSRKAMAVETRSPRGVSEFLPHKFRKSNAFLRESLRFLYRLPEMTGLGKTLLLVRTAQQLLLPWLLLFWLLTAGAILTLFRFDLVLFGAAFLFVLFGTTSVVFAGTRLPEPPRRYSLVTVAVGYVLTNFILMVTALSYPFFRQGSTYARLDGGAKAVPEDRS